MVSLSLPNVSRYYDKTGSPTAAWYRVQKLLEDHDKEEAERKELQKRFPGCNSHWTKEEGGTVYCSEKRFEASELWRLCNDVIPIVRSIRKQPPS